MPSNKAGFQGFETRIWRRIDDYKWAKTWSGYKVEIFAPINWSVEEMGSYEFPRNGNKDVSLQ